MIRIESFYATNQPWWMNPTTPSHLPSIYLPVKELSDTWSMNLKALRVYVYNFMPIDDQRPRPPPTTRRWTADTECRLKLPLQMKLCRSTYSRQHLMRDLSRARTLVDSSFVA